MEISTIAQDQSLDQQLQMLRVLKGGLLAMKSDNIDDEQQDFIEVVGEYLKDLIKIHKLELKLPINGRMTLKLEVCLQ